MIFGYARGPKLHNQLNRLELIPVDEIFYDSFQADNPFSISESSYQEMLDYTQPGDTIIVTSLEVLSRDYAQLLRYVDVFEKLDLIFHVVNLPHMNCSEWRQWLKWIQSNERILYPQLVQLKTEKARNRNNYSIFSRDSDAKKLYRDVIRQLLRKEKLSLIAKRNGLPLETVYRIKQEVERVKMAIMFVTCFLLAMISFKITESFSENIWIQLLIGTAFTLIILYNTLVDTDETEA